MKLVGKEDIEAPLAFVYRTLTHFEIWERAAMRRGAEVSRTDTLLAPGVGQSWDVKLTYRGKPREIDIKVSALEAPHHLGFTAHAGAIDAQLGIELVELAPRRTRMTITLDVSPRTMTARLLMQSIKLARGKVDQRFDARISLIGADISHRFRTQTTS